MAPSGYDCCSHSISPIRQSRKGFLYCTDHSTQAGSKLAELRAGKCIWIHPKTISAAYPHVCWVFPTCLITSFVIGWQSWSTKTLWIKIVIVIVICAEMLQNIVILSEKSPFVVKRSQLFLLKPPALVFWKKKNMVFERINIMQEEQCFGTHP